MKSKIKKCGTCGADIAANAKLCPHCGAKNKKTLTTKWWFWVVIFVGIGIIGGLVPSDDNDSSPSNSSSNSNINASSSESTIDNSDIKTEESQEEQPPPQSKTYTQEEFDYIYNIAYEEAIKNLPFEAIAEYQNVQNNIKELIRTRQESGAELTLDTFLAEKSEYESYSRDDPQKWMKDCFDTALYYDFLASAIDLASGGNQGDLEMVAILYPSIDRIQERMDKYNTWTYEMRNDPQNDNDIIVLATLDAAIAMAYSTIE